MEVILHLKGRGQGEFVLSDRGTKITCDLTSDMDLKISRTDKGDLLAQSEAGDVEVRVLEFSN